MGKLRKKGLKNKVIKVTVVTNRDPKPQVWENILNLAKYPRVQMPNSKIVYNMRYHFVRGSLVHDGRNDATNILKPEDHFDYLMFVDDDMVWDNDWIPILASYDLPVVGGLCVRKTYPFRPTVFMLDPETGKLAPPVLSPAMFEQKREDLVISVAGIGMGFTMIRGDVFDKIEPPYFWFDFRPNKIAGDEQPMGEDVYFCEKVRKAGIKIYCDFGMWPGHIGERVCDIRDYHEALSERAQEIHEKTGKNVEDAKLIPLRDSDDSSRIPSPSESSVEAAPG